MESVKLGMLLLWHVVQLTAGLYASEYMLSAWDFWMWSITFRPVISEFSVILGPVKLGYLVWQSTQVHGFL